MLALTGAQIAEGLSSIQKTADGSTYAFSELVLEERGLESLGDALADYEHLRVIKLNKNKLGSIDKLRTLKLVQTLEARGNQISDNYFMSESKQQLKFLTTVDLSGNKLTKLRQLLCKLRTLTLDNNQIEEADMVGHGSLVNLSVVKNKLTTLEGFQNLTALENLNLAENEITALTGIKNCASLKTLNLTQNKILAFGDVPCLPALQVLNLTGNPIESLDEIAKLSSLSNLKSINLTETPLAEAKGDDLKKEVLILLDECCSITTFNGEEVSGEEIQEAKDTKKERIEAERLRLKEEAEAAAAAAAEAAAAAAGGGGED